MTNNADPTDLGLHCLQKQVYPGSAGLELTLFAQASLSKYLE